MRHFDIVTVVTLNSIALALLLLTPALHAEIRYLPSSRLWHLSAAGVSYVIGVNNGNQLQQIYWGPRLWREADLPAARAGLPWASFDTPGMTTPEEYPAWGGGRHLETCLKLTRADGVREVILEYAAHSIEDGALMIRLKDKIDNIRVTLTYRISPTGIVEKKASILNGTAQPVTVESLQSGVWNLPTGSPYRLTTTFGRWAGEWQLESEDVRPGQKILESRRGLTSHQANPWFMLDDGHATESHGRVWFGALAWSGNWRLTVEQSTHGQVRVTGGYNPFDFAWPLEPGQSLESPSFYAGFTAGGFGGASRLLHRFTRNEILPTQRLRPVLYNSWEATTFHVTEEGQKALATLAARLGVERFVMDDGWFGARNDDRAGLGDWTVNPQKFPRGLKPLIDHVHNLGMDFGLWVEPEMVNPDSNLYRAHPDWALHQTGRPRAEQRHQLMLNLARDDVREYLFTVLDRLVTENAIQFLKWDANRNMTEPGWPEVPPSDQKKLYIRYTRNFYEIIDRLRRKHPGLEIESCSGGGGRVDLGILRRADQVWTSDNTDALDRLRIQEGFSYAYPARVMMAWVTDVPNFNHRSTPLAFRFLAAMQGALGIGNNLNKMSARDLDFSKRMIAWYKSIRATIQTGNLYRLASPRASDFSANQYVSADGKQSVVFGLLHSQRFGYPVPPLRLEGLEEKAVYRLHPLDPGKIDLPTPELSGAWLMNHGISFRLTGDYDGSAVVIERVDASTP